MGRKIVASVVATLLTVTFALCLLLTLVFSLLRLR